MSDVPAPEVRGILVTHGAMAGAMVEAVRRITGVGEEALVPVSNVGKGPDELRVEILGLVGDGPTLVLTDLGAGSCTLAARLSCQDRERVALVTGVNLPMLLDFVFHRSLPLDQLAGRLVAKGRAGVTLLTAPRSHADPPVSR
jgi:mannose/fructose-specific phosphotransferase system component IIA